MQFKDLPTGTSFTIKAQKCRGNEAIIAGNRELIAAHVEVIPTYEPIKPFSRIRSSLGAEGQYLRDGYVYWDNNKYPNVLPIPPTTEFYVQC